MNAHAPSPVKRIWNRSIRFQRLGVIAVLSGMLCMIAVIRAEGATPSPSWPHAHSDLSPAPELHFGRLSNGLDYVLQRNLRPAERVSMHLYVRVGALHEADAERGLAHFLEHLQFNGSEHFPPGELVKYFQRIGMDFGPDANARTGFDSTVYDILLPKNRPTDIREGLAVLSDYARGALLLPEEIERERRVVLAEMRSRDSAAYRTFVETLAFEFPGTRLPRRLPIGDSDAIGRMDRNLIKGFYDAWYRPEALMLVVVGDMSIAETAAAIADIFGTLGPRAAARSYPGIGRFHHSGLKSFYHFEKEAGETTVRLEVVYPADKAPDSHLRRSERFAAEVADRIVQDRLNAMFGKIGTPFTGASISSGTFLNEIQYAEISAQCDPENWSRTLAVIEQTLRQALDFGFTLDELARVNKDVSAELSRAESEMPTRLSQSIARSLIGELNEGRVPLSPIQEKALYGAILERLTPAEVLAAFQRTWSPAHRLLLVTGNADLGAGGIDASGALRAALQASAATPVHPYEDRALQAFPYLPPPPDGGVIIESDIVTDLGITRLTFDNGVRAFIKPTDFKADEIQVRVSFGPGRSGVPADLPALGLFAEDLLNESGVGRMPKDALDAALAGKNVSAFFSMKEDRFAIEGRADRKDLELLFQLITARLLDPALRHEAAQLVKARYAQAYRADASSFRKAMKVWGGRQLAGGDPRFGMLPDDIYAARTIAEVQVWLLPFFTAAPLEVVVVGDVDAEGTARLTRRYFGTLPPRKEIPTPVPGVSFPAGKRSETPISTRIGNSLLVVALPTADAWDIAQTRRLSILSEIISEKLRVVVREALGATYSPFAFNRGSRAYAGYGTLVILAEVAPLEAERVMAEIRSLITALAETGVTDDLLRRAVDPILTGIRDMQKQNGYWTDTVLAGASRHPEQLSWSRSIADDYASVTVSEINALARQYLVMSRAATLFFYPRQP